MAKFAKRPTDEFDRDLQSKGLKRVQVLSEILPTNTNKLDEDGNPIYLFGSVYREKIVPITSDSFKPARKVSLPKASKGARTKLDQAVDICKELNFNKEKSLAAIVEQFKTSVSNATIYFKKAQERTNAI